VNRNIYLSALLFVVALAFACDKSEKSTPTPTPRAIPSPVTVAQAPEQGFTLADPALDALPGAAVESGILGGAAYQIELPDNWNGRLLMYMHGNDIDTTLHVYPPRNRNYLIRNGYAWASSSYSVNVFVVNGIAADETAALWDFFVKKHGVPQRSYVMGDSMGGAATVVAAERYGNRFDGALALCPDAPPSDGNTDFFVIGAFVAGVTQAEFDSSDPAAIIGGRIRPALTDPAVRKRFEDIWIDRSGGPRPFDRKSIRVNEEQLWIYAVGNTTNPSYSNDTKVYELGPSAGVSSDEFNRGAVRFKGDPSRDKYAENNAVTGELQIPTITLQPTGDNLTVFSESQEIRRRVEAAGKGDLLVQRAVQSPFHCFSGGLSSVELQTSLEDLVAWVEDGIQPDGEDLLGDVSDAGIKFTSAPRIDSPAADAVRGARDRIVLEGTLTLDGDPITEGFLWAIVEREGVFLNCSYEFPVFPDGRYEMPVSSDTESEGCSAPGARIGLAYFSDGENFVSGSAIDAPSPGARVQFDGVFLRSAPGGYFGAGPLEDLQGTGAYGELIDASGKPMPSGTRVEAFIGDTLCGRFVSPPMIMVFTEPNTYAISVARPESIAGCTADAPIELRVNGAAVPTDISHDFTSHNIDLRLP
jgi:pimeloyl-ACP methyl ester carboxylesterase